MRVFPCSHRGGVICSSVRDESIDETVVLQDLRWYLAYRFFPTTKKKKTQRSTTATGGRSSVMDQTNGNGNRTWMSKILTLEENKQKSTTAAASSYVQPSRDTLPIPTA